MRKNCLYGIIVSALLFTTCSKDATQKVLSPYSDKMVTAAYEQDNTVAAGYKTYVIKKGDNYCSPNPLVFITKNQIRFNAVFDSSCIYSTVDPNNQADINKLYGFSDCNSQHLINSARIGWRWYNNTLQLLAFVHKDGVIQPDLLITTLPVGTVANCRITCKPSVYEFEVNGIIVQAPRGCSGSYTRYRLYPYFGGDETAPHDVKILIQNL